MIFRFYVSFPGGRGKVEQARKPTVGGGLFKRFWIFFTPKLGKWYEHNFSMGVETCFTPKFWGNDAL